MKKQFLIAALFIGYSFNACASLQQALADLTGSNLTEDVPAAQSALRALVDGLCSATKGGEEGLKLAWPVIDSYKRKAGSIDGSGIHGQVSDVLDALMKPGNRTLKNVKAAVQALNVAFVDPDSNHFLNAAIPVAIPVAGPTVLQKADLGLRIAAIPAAVYVARKIRNKELITTEETGHAFWLHADKKGLGLSVRGTRYNASFLNATAVAVVTYGAGSVLNSLIGK